ncbi:thioredoxin domain-containing protein [Lacinutrix mariniflava]|uniref:thioredoxin domain-containing protein n=1 Tax=Lacinutrix mariniflava TaxID=342955 RepID=UPI0006E45F43|nr:thioredoxin domain-containing protein [Lacinutrix mariniflava]
MTRTVIITVILSLCLSFGFSQSLNKRVKYGDNKDMLLGEIDKNGLQSAPFNTWFNKNHDDYIVNKNLVKTFKKDLKNYTIKAFLGTWCGDSKKEVPRFYKVLEAANFPMNQLETFALDKSDDAYKQGPNGEEKGLNIHRVPTFIFYKNGKEVNRIVEHAKETFEHDILSIVNTDHYRQNYIAVDYLHSLLEDKSLDSLKAIKTDLTKKLGRFVKSSGELNTFGYVLLRSKQIEKALYVFDLNTKLYAYKLGVYDSLAEAFFVAENYNEALKNYYKVLSIMPNDKNALEMVDKITKLNS